MGTPATLCRTLDRDDLIRAPLPAASTMAVQAPILCAPATDSGREPPVSSGGGPCSAPLHAPSTAPRMPLQNAYPDSAMVRTGFMECQGSRARVPATDPVARDRIDGYGEMAERFKAAVSKTVVGASSTVGSNPTLSAIRRTRNAPDQPLLRPARLSQCGEVPEWPNGHDWKSCRGRKSLAGSNPALSASV